MIISASYKTDIPAFYGQWFLNRLEAGYCRMVNPYGRQVYTVDLRPEAVDGFVFWTRNIGPFFAALSEVHKRGYPFVIQHGVMGYPRQLDHHVIAAARAIDLLKRIAGEFGPRTVVWRYDTIVFSSITPADFHLSNFERIAAGLQGVTDEVVISFAQIYRKTLRNLTQAARDHGFTWTDPDDEVKHGLCEKLVRIARSRGMRLSICSQRQYVVDGAAEARCIDARRLSDIAGRPIHAGLRGNRPDCACHASRDIGDYDTCPHGCVYCYAVRNHALAMQRYRRHDPASEMLFEDAPPSPPLPANSPQAGLPECREPRTPERRPAARERTVSANAELRSENIRPASAADW